MARKKEITFAFFVGNTPVERLSAAYLENMIRCLSERMSDYYTAHPDEFAALKQGRAPST